MRAILVVAAFVFSPLAGAQEDPAGAGPWSIEPLKLATEDENVARDFTLVMAGEKTKGIAFRCDAARMYAFVAPREANIAELMAKTARKAKKWEVSVSVGDGEAIEEAWVSMHGGRLMMIRNLELTNELFEKAKTGTSITIDPRYGKPQTIELPADKSGQFDAFRERCHGDARA